MMNRLTTLSSRVFIPLLSLMLLSCSTAEGDRSITCPEGQENEEGVGRACSSHADCAGLKANFCPAAELSTDLDFCTRPCNPFLSDGDILACGTNARCTDHGWGPALCVPSQCSDELTITPLYPEASIPCDVDEAVNEIGVGKPCEVHADCEGLPAGKCPMDIHPELPTWCSVLCDAHADCGLDAFCWVRPSVDGGLVGSCAPIQCRVYPEVDLNCAVTTINLSGIGHACDTEKDCENLDAANCGTNIFQFEKRFCTKICIHDEDCGANAFCWHDVTMQSSACIPILCMH